MARISRPQLFMMMARAAAMRSTCFRLNVGAVVVIDNRPVSIGYNGTPAGAPHCGGNDCPGKLHCQETIHAEVNALLHIPDHIGIRTDADLYVTHSPCAHCAEQITKPNSPIARVFFEATYRNTDHLADLAREVELYQVTPAGFVIDWITGAVIEE